MPSRPANTLACLLVWNSWKYFQGALTSFCHIWYYYHKNLALHHMQTEKPRSSDNMVFHALTFARSRGRCWKPRPKAGVFNTSQGTWRMLMHWKTMFDRYYCINTGNICYISLYFLHYLVSPFHLCLAKAISTAYARSRAGQYTSSMAANL